MDIRLILIFTECLLVDECFPWDTRLTLSMPSTRGITLGSESFSYSVSLLLDLAVQAIGEGDMAAIAAVSIRHRLV